MRKPQGFTVVELIVVVIIIGLLAGIVIVGYGAWRTSIAEKSMRSDIDVAVSTLESDRTWNNDYPSSASDAGNGQGLVGSEGNTLSYMRLGSAFCIQATSTNSPKAFSYTTVSKSIQEGMCTFKGTNKAGSGQMASIDGTGESAAFYTPQGIALSPDERILYVVDTTGNQIRKVDTATWEVTTLAGIAGGGTADGPGNVAGFRSPYGITVTPAGIIYVAECNGQRIRKILPDGTVSTFAGPTSYSYGYAEGTGTSARFWCPASITYDKTGNLYVFEFNNYRIRKITPSGQTSTYAGSGVNGFADGAAADAMFSGMGQLVFDKAGNLYVSDSNNRRIRKITPDGMVSTVVGTGVAGDTQGPALSSMINYPVGLAMSGDTLYIGTINGLRAYNTQTGMLEKPQLTGDVTNMTAAYGLALSKQGILYLSQRNDNRIRTMTF